MRTTILKVKGDWQEVVDDCRATVGKTALGHEPSDLFKRNLLIAEHSPIRDISIKWKWENIKSWVATHFSRHKWECFIRTQRTDRTGTERDTMCQDEPVTFIGEANTQALIDTMRKRLCRQAAEETRAYAESLKEAISNTDAILGGVLVPHCVYRGGCPEIYDCGYYSALCVSYPKMKGAAIWERYEIYNRDFKEKRG